VTVFEIYFLGEAIYDKFFVGVAFFGEGFYDPV
jgi:hypothetical protein